MATNPADLIGGTINGKRIVGYDPVGSSSGAGDIPRHPHLILEDWTRVVVDAVGEIVPPPAIVKSVTETAFTKGSTHETK